ncbi:MAG: dephospho-CoA kinase [gamma proteobacterium symbiont of Phacoides pectinatus]
MLIIGLTGGIASGKSTVTQRFQAHGVPVIDADLIARELVQPGQPALDAISRHFGDAILRIDGTLNRRALRNLMFDNPVEKQWVEQLLHPLIWRRMRHMLEQMESPYAILSIPLLAESGTVDRVDRILVVDCPEALQIQRVCARDECTRQQAQTIIDSQASRKERLAIADDLITNTSTQSHLEGEVSRLHQKYLNLSRQQKHPGLFTTDPKMYDN